MKNYKATMQANGQIALPPEWLEEHGVRSGDEIDIAENEDGSITLFSNDIILSNLLIEIGDALKAEGITLEQLLEDSEQIRQEIYDETYGRHKVGEDA